VGSGKFWERFFLKHGHQVMIAIDFLPLPHSVPNKILCLPPNPKALLSAMAIQISSSFTLPSLI
jgi:hypothetical protein